MREPYLVYAKPNDAGYITSVNSSEFLTDLIGWVEIDSGYGDRYLHAMGNYFPTSVMTDGEAYRYKLADGKVVSCAAEEIAAQEAENRQKEKSSGIWDELDAAYQEGVDSV